MSVGPGAYLPRITKPTKTSFARVINAVQRTHSIACVFFNRFGGVSVTSNPEIARQVRNPIGFYKADCPVGWIEEDLIYCGCVEG